MNNEISLGTISIQDSCIIDPDNWGMYFEELNKGLENLFDLPAYEPTEKIKSQFLNIIPKQRKIVAKIFYRGIGYIVTDEGSQEQNGNLFGLRTKGYFQSIYPKTELEEIKDKKNLENLFQEMCYQVQKDLVE